MEVLEQLTPDRANQVQTQVNVSAFSELGEDHFDRREHQEGSFPGPDIRYQWFPPGSIQLFEKLLTRFDPAQIVVGFKSGLRTEDSRNYNGETELYICCRAGNAETVRELLHPFEWALKQTTVATNDGCTPFHFLYRFLPDDVEKVAGVLLANGADINATDESNQRAIDHAISAGRDDVALFLLGQQESLFKDPALHDADLNTAIQSTNNASEKVLQYCLTNADLETQLELLSRLSHENLELRIARGRFSNLKILLNSISGFLVMEFPPLIDLLQKTLSLAIVASNYDVIVGITKQILPKSGIDEERHADLLMVAARCSHFADFELLVSVPTKWTAHYGYRVFSAILEFSGPSQHEIAESWFVHLNNMGIIKEAVNYVSSGCTPNCEKHSSHKFTPSLFASAVLRDCHDIARLIEPHIHHDTGFPTALYHVLNETSIKTLDHIDFLMNLGPEHRKYVYYPIYNHTAIQVVTKGNENYKSPYEVTSILETLLEWFAYTEEDIDAIDDHRATALFYATDYTCPEAVQMLIEWGTDPLREVQVKLFIATTNELVDEGVDLARQNTASTFGAYSYGLYQTYYLLVRNQQINNQMTRGKPFFNTSVPLTNQDDAMHKMYLQQCETLAALSYKVDSVSDHPFSRNEFLDGMDAGCKIEGLVPRTKRVRFEKSVGEKGDMSIEVWGVYYFGEREISLHVGLRDELSAEDVATEIDKHKARWTPHPESLVVLAMWGISQNCLHRFLVTRLSPARQQLMAGLAKMQISDFEQDKD